MARASIDQDWVTDSAASGKAQGWSPYGLAGFYFLVLMLVLINVGGFPLIDTLNLDASSIERIAARGGGQAFEGSYATAAFFYGVLGEFRGLFIALMALLFFYISMRHQQTAISVMIVVFLVFPAVVFFLTQFNKDTLLIPFLAVVCVALYSRSMGSLTQIAIIVVMYVVYALLFRVYYALILLTFLSLMMFISMPRIQKFATIAFLPFLAMLVFFLVPPEYFDELTKSRDLINATRSSVAGSRTMFFNAVVPDGPVAFIINYLNAFRYLNLPLLHSLSLTELFLQIYVVAALGMAVIMAGHSSFAIRACGVMFLSHVALLICFEPDLGSYLRHLASAAPFLATGLALGTLEKGSRAIRNPGGAVESDPTVIAAR